MKILKTIVIAFFILFAYIGISQRNAQGGENNIYFGIICLLIAVILFISTILKHFFHTSTNTKNKRNAPKKYDPSLQSNAKTVLYTANAKPAAGVSYIEDSHIIARADGQEISDEEIPYLIQTGYEEALRAEKKSSNPKYYRTEREEELCIQFMMNHGDDIQKHTVSFEEACRMAHSEKDLNTKIELLQNAIDLYEREKKWFYRTKGGMFYFQDYYEHMHSSSGEVFSYIDSIKDYLEYNTHKRDYTIPKIISLITSRGGILQKDIYEYLPGESKSDIQQVIRELEGNDTINRTKKDNSYLLTLHQ